MTEGNIGEKVFVAPCAEEDQHERKEAEEVFWGGS